MSIFGKLVDETQKCNPTEATRHHNSIKLLILLVFTPQSHLESYVSIRDTLYKETKCFGIAFFIYYLIFPQNYFPNGNHMWPTLFVKCGFCFKLKLLLICVVQRTPLSLLYHRLSYTRPDDNTPQ